MAQIICSKCGIQFSMPDHRDRALRASHKTFWCPNGHNQYYPGKTDEEKKIARLEKWLNEAQDDRDRHFAFTDDSLAALKACPLRCGWRSRKVASRFKGDEAWERGLLRVQADLLDHMVTEHGLDLPVEAENWLAEVAR